MAKPRIHLCRQLLALTVLTVAALPIQLGAIKSFASAAANRELQARVLIRGIVSRVAFYHVIGRAVDLPIRLIPCENRDDRSRTYSTIKAVIDGIEIDRGVSAFLCHPHTEEFVSLNENNKRLTFMLPPRTCSNIKSTVINIIDDTSGDTFHKLLNTQAQSSVRRVFEGKARGYVNTSGTLRFGPFLIAVTECTEQHDRDELNISMRKQR